LFNQDLYILALALGISGFITYKTFQWALYEEIGPGMAALFLGFAIVVFLGMNNFDFGKLLISQREKREGEVDVLKHIDAELQNQAEATRRLTETVRQAFERTHELAKEADKNGQVALDTVSKSHEKSEEVISVTASATWEILMGEFRELEDYLKRWEEKNGLRRGWDTAHSLVDLAKKLDRLETPLPEPIRTLYFERQRKYEILKKIKESSESRASSQMGAGFNLPAPPKLPATVTVSKEPEIRNPVQ
jgi:hypothetical protein